MGRNASTSLDAEPNTHVRTHTTPSRAEKEKASTSERKHDANQDQDHHHPRGAQPRRALPAPGGVRARLQRREATDERAQAEDSRAGFEGRGAENERVRVGPPSPRR